MRKDWTPQEGSGSVPIESAGYLPQADDSDTGESCAHRRVVYIEVHHGNGLQSNRWECDLCRTEFSPIPWRWGRKP